MIAKRYKKRNYKYSIVSVFLSLLIVISPFFFGKTKQLNVVELIENIGYAIGYMLLVFYMIFIDNQTSLLGIKGIHLLIYPLMLLALPDTYYSIDQLLVFVVFIFCLNNHALILQNRERYKLLFTMTLVLTLVIWYDVKYALYLIFPLSLFANRHFLNLKHLLTFLIPLVFTLFFIFGVYTFFEIEYRPKKLSFEPTAAIESIFNSSNKLFWIGLILFSLLGYFQKNMLSAIKTTNTFNFMFYGLLVSFVLLLFKTNTPSEQILIGLIAAGYFIGDFIDKLHLEWIKDFLIIAIITIGITIRLNQHHIL